MEFGERLKQARLNAGLTQEDVVRQLGVSRQTVSNWENNRSYPDLGSVLKLSDIYDLSLDDLLREDMQLRRWMEQKRKRWENLGGLLHDFALLLVASMIPLAWLEKTTLGIALGVAGIVLICIVHLLFVFRLGSDRKVMALRCLSMLLWFSGYMIRILSSHTEPIGDVLWYGGHALYFFGAGHLKWNVEYPRHMTVFTGFVMALVIVFGTIPFVGDSLERGDHVENNPFNSRDYRVAQVLAGETEPLPMVYLGSTNSVYLDWPGAEEKKLEGKFTYITQPEGAETKGVWELLDGENLYRVTVEADGSVTMACLEKDQTRWAYLLEPSPKMGCTILDVLGTVTGPADWYYAGTFDSESDLSGLPLRAKGSIKLSVPGDSETVTIYEEFRDGDAVEHQTMVLTKDKRGFVQFKRETRQNGQKQTGIYRIPYQDGEFVLVLNFMK